MGQTIRDCLNYGNPNEVDVFSGLLLGSSVRKIVASRALYFVFSNDFGVEAAVELVVRFYGTIH